MSVHRLDQLLETGQYQLCLEEALALLAGGSEVVVDGARVWAAICRCRVESGAWREAAEAGEKALAITDAGTDPDLVGAVLVDLGTARARLRQHAKALETWKRYLDLLPELAGSKCQEGFVHMQMASVLRRLGHPDQALTAFEAARRWFDRYGDERSRWECARAMFSIALERGEFTRARALLKLGDDRMTDESAAVRGAHLLDWARYRLATGMPAMAAGLAFRSLELSDSLEEQGQAQMVLSQAAQAQDRPVEALAFALAARVSAMEGSLYGLEFDASEMIFRLLRTHGSGLMDQVAADFEQQGVDIYDYLSELAVRRWVT